MFWKFQVSDANNDARRRFLTDTGQEKHFVNLIRGEGGMIWGGGGRSILSV